jgi:hypothetical protein
MFYQLNDGRNAEPNAPSSSVELQGDDLVLKSFVNI